MIKKLEGYFVAYRGNRWGSFCSKEKAEVFGKKLKLRKETILGNHYPFSILNGIAIVANQRLCVGSKLCCIDWIE